MNSIRKQLESPTGYRHEGIWQKADDLLGEHSINLVISMIKNNRFAFFNHIESQLYESTNRKYENSIS